jgi:hypothetical protein
MDTSTIAGAAPAVLSLACCFALLVVTRGR